MATSPMPRSRSAIAVLLSAGTLATIAGVAGTSAALAQSDDAHAHLPETLELVGIVRDFKERGVDGGHPDFERAPGAGFGHYVGIVADELGSGDKPEFASTGFALVSEWRDAQGRPMLPPRDDIAAREGDVAGEIASTAGDAVTSAATFASWFRDVPMVNVSRTLAISLQRQPGTNVYVFDDTEDPTYQDRGGFFPIDGELFGNSAGEDRNFHFTYELATEFVYDSDAPQTFRFVGDDDVWVFVDGRLVIDIGGVHAKIDQTIDLSRLEWLEDGKVYSLHFFFAERHRAKSNFRIETTLNLRSKPITTPPSMLLYD